jgi:hypothetical protein
VEGKVDEIRHLERDLGRVRSFGYLLDLVATERIQGLRLWPVVTGVDFE